MKTQYANDSHYYSVYLESGYVINARDMGNISRFVNHSCNPNCDVQLRIVNGLPCVAVFALRNILAGEELTFNYKFESFNIYKKEKCKCMAENCRGIIGAMVLISLTKQTYVK